MKANARQSQHGGAAEALKVVGQLGRGEKETPDPESQEVPARLGWEGQFHSEAAAGAAERGDRPLLLEQLGAAGGGPPE